ncbi:MAG: hypothetical protein OEW41_03135 [Actinomycetota bacterium]|nr:hypothetical protein [Actinomycetota bacterium]
MRPHRRLSSVVVASMAVLFALAMVPAPAGAASEAGSATRDTNDNTGEFEDSTDIDSHFFPLQPGARTVYRGTVTDEDGRVRHRIVFTVTDLLKDVSGVVTRVVWDRDISEGHLDEAELAFFAQDEAQNVWTFGEYPEEYEDGEFAGAPSTWLNGVQRAEAGILVPGHPSVDLPAFVQGFAPAIDFFDKGRVIRTDRHVCVAVGCFDDVVVIDEWNPLDPDDGHQRKLYAPGVGLVKITARGGDSREIMELVKQVHLGPRSLAISRAEALRLDARAYRFAKRVYRDTRPAYLPSDCTDDPYGR